MTYEMYRNVFFGLAVACGGMAVVCGILFFAWKIPGVIGDLTGHTAKKAIADIRKQNEASGDKRYQSSAVNLQRGKLTDKITDSGRLLRRDTAPFGTGTVTEQLDCSEQQDTVVTDETTVLTDAGKSTPYSGVPTTAVFEVEQEITFLHTDEVIAQ